MIIYSFENYIFVTYARILAAFRKRLQFTVTVSHRLYLIRQKRFVANLYEHFTFVFCKTMTNDNVMYIFLVIIATSKSRLTMMYV